MKLVEAALVETGYLKALTQGVRGCVEAAPDNPQAAPVDTSQRDEWGRFGPGYNERLRKGPNDAIGPGFETVEKKRQGLAVERLHVSGASAEVVERKLLALMVSPLLGSGRWDGLRVARGELLEELCGYPYMPSTLDLHVRELKYLGVSSTLWEIHAVLFVNQTGQWGDPKRAAVLYVDGSNKPVFTDLFSQATKVSHLNKVMPALDVVAFHSGYGVPLYQVTHSGRAALVEAVPKLLTRMEPMLEGTVVGGIVVVDAEGNSVPFLMGLEQGEPARAWVTRLRPSMLEGKRIFNRSNYRAYRNGDRVRMGVADLNVPGSKGKKKFRVRVVEVERRSKGTVTYLGGSMRLDDRVWKPEQVADLYFDRWPYQEANFRAVNQAVDSKKVHGYGKQLVDNVTVVNELDELGAQIQNEWEQIDRGTKELETKEKEFRQEQTRVRRSERRLKTVERKVDASVAHGQRIGLPLRRLVVQQRTLGKEVKKQSARVARLKRDADSAQEGMERRRQRLDKHIDRQAQLESRRSIFRHDVELDSLFGLFKVGLVLMLMYVLKEYFGEARMDPVTFLERIATLPARRLLTPQVERVTFEYNRRDPDIMALLTEHCEAINARGLRTRSGRILRLQVDPAPPPIRPPPLHRRVNPGDRFRKRQPKV
jgi:hypothetical protein